MAKAELKLSEKDLAQWNLLTEFRLALARAVPPQELHSSFRDPERQLAYADYLSLFLFGLLNPVVATMRALCSVSQLQRVQQEVCGRSVSLGAFSEAQHLVHPAHLQRVFGDLMERVPGAGPTPASLAWRTWLARDSSLFRALPRMTWALYGGGKAGAPNRAVRWHLNFHLWDDKPTLCDITPGRVCERKSWQGQWQKGAGYVGDRYFSQNFQLFGQLQERGCAYVLRLIEEATLNVETEIPMSAADRQQGVVRQAWATLGKEGHRSVRLRVIWIEGPDCALLLVTNLSPEDLAAELVSLLYRRRWQIECFFKWVKCLLGCRHWLAESPNGVEIQLYLALIASVLMQLFLGRRPNKRMLELLRFYQMGWATLSETIAGLRREQGREEQRQKTKR